MLNKKKKRNYDLFCKFIRAVFHIVHFMSVKNPFQAFFFKWGFIGKIDIPLFLSVNAVTQIWVQKFAEGDRGLRV